MQEGLPESVLSKGEQSARDSGPRGGLPGQEECIRM